MSLSLKCDQAIFTSTRTPMGEGYRIIAASPGVRAEEKQAITRNSPSHDSLCSTAPDTQAVAFYALPGGRLCAAVSGYAGAEHTGRGGQRIYTHNVIFDGVEFARLGQNPFVVLRGMISTGLLTPQLTPSTSLPELDLAISESAAPGSFPNFSLLLSPAARCHILQRLLDDSSVVVHLEKDWFECAEALVLGLPGPMRPRISFAAGMKFSVGRSHRLHLLSDDKGLARAKVTGQKTEYVEPGAVAASNADRSAWVDFVEHHWATQDWGGLVKRTSRPFTDVSPPGRERIGRLYNFMDEVSRTDPAKLISRVGELLPKATCRIEQEIRSEYLEAARRELIARFNKGTLAQSRPVWSGIIGLWRRSAEGTEFAQPLIHAMVRSAMQENPLAGAELAMEVASNLPPTVNQAAHNAFLDEVLSQLRLWAVHAPGDQLDQLGRLCSRWRAIRPMCPIIRETAQQCHAAASATNCSMHIH